MESAKMRKNNDTCACNTLFECSLYMLDPSIDIWTLGHMFKNLLQMSMHEKHNTFLRVIPIILDIRTYTGNQYQARNVELITYQKVLGHNL